jgi:signal transduction histidine kinase
MTILEQPRSALSKLLWEPAGGIGIAVGVGLAYFLAAELSLELLMESDGVAVFWPAAGISAGAMIALGPRAWWPVAAAAMAATFVANVMSDRNVPAAAAFAVCNAAEALIAAGVIYYYFGSDFRFNRLRQVLGLLAAGVIATALSGLGGTLAYQLFHSPTVPMLTTWRHWFASDVVGIVAVAPLVIGLAAAVRRPPRRRELVEGLTALALLAATTGLIISLPQEPLQTVVPGALLFPILLWLAARCRPLFATAGAFMVSFAIVWTTIFGIGHFGDTDFPIENRIVEAQALILVATLGAFVLAALFAEQRFNVERLAHANKLLESERDNRFSNLEAVIASIAHEVKQPLASIALNSSAALRFLKAKPADLNEVEAALSAITSEGHRASHVFDSVRSLFRGFTQEPQPIDVNSIALEVLQSVRRELRDRDITAWSQLTAELPPVQGNRHQLLQVLFNLVHNSVEAMDTTKDRPRVLRIGTERCGRGAVAVSVQDTGPGIDPKQASSIFDAFFTTKAHGMGLGLAICRMIIERHGGQLTASSDGRNGALFRFVLPIEPADQAKATPPRS